MTIEKRVVTISTREDVPGVTTAGAIVVEIDGIEIPGISDINIEPLSVDGLVVANIRLHVRIGK